MTKAMLIATAVLEATTGIVLLAAPAWFSLIMLGAPVGVSAGIVLARVAGIALIALGIICWRASHEAKGWVAWGIVAAMLFYNVAAAVLLVSARLGLCVTGAGVIPIAVLHAVMAAWCIGCMRTFRS